MGNGYSLPFRLLQATDDMYSFVSAFIIGVDSDDAYKNSVSISDMFLQAYEIWISGLLLSSLPPVKEIQNYLLPLLCRNVF